MQSSDPTLHSDQQRVQAHLDVIQHLALLLLRGEAGYLSAPQRRCIESIARHANQLLANTSPQDHRQTLPQNQLQPLQPELSPIEATHSPLQHFSQAPKENLAGATEAEEFATNVDLPLALPALHRHSLLTRATLGEAALATVPAEESNNPIFEIEDFPNHELEIHIPPNPIEFSQVTVFSNAIADASELRRLFSPGRRDETRSALTATANNNEQRSLVKAE